jgi:ERCC4-related helicase
LQAGTFNVLVSTSVGEEGLDVGEVDLVIFFDSTSNPTRSTQRIGRAGRKREGRIVVLATEGKEYGKFESMLNSRMVNCNYTSKS